MQNRIHWRFLAIVMALGLSVFWASLWAVHRWQNARLSLETLILSNAVQEMVERRGEADALYCATNHNPGSNKCFICRKRGMFERTARQRIAQFRLKIATIEAMQTKLVRMRDDPFACLHWSGDSREYADYLRDGGYDGRQALPVHTSLVDRNK